jgi:hypothetical protein
MSSRLGGIPRYKTVATLLPAALFNEVRLALLRLQDSLRFPVRGLRTLHVIIDKDAWIVVDSSLNDVPVLAWTEFETAHRDSLHQPIRCKLYLYHAHADIIIEAVLNELHKELDARLHATLSSENG